MDNLELEFLQKSKIIPILKTLNEYEGELTKTVLTSMVSAGTGDINTKYKLLTEMGLIHVREGGRMLNQGHWVSLTEKGKAVAEHLIAIQEIISRK